MLDKKVIRAKLPAVGHRLRIQPARSAFINVATWAEVEYVNKKAMWFMVRYMGSGMRECFSGIADMGK